MQIQELNKDITHSSQIITDFILDKRKIRVIETFGDTDTFDDLFYSIACRKITERLSNINDKIAVANGHMV